jgi:hypothetical protein
MANPKHLEIINQGVDVWNLWRHGNNIYEVDLSGAPLGSGDLSGAYLRNANLTGANLSGTKLIGADLSLANLTGACLVTSNLSRANLVGADFTGADLEVATITGANLSFANLSQADVQGIRWDRKAMRRCFKGMRGVESCYGDALFRRDARDQDFVDTLDSKCRSSWWRKTLFWAWGFFLDYGRSMGRVALWSTMIIFLFGLLHSLCGTLEYTNNPTANVNGFAPYFFSIVTFTTLGYGDIAPKSVIGQVAASAEVIMGYITLGLLLSILADKIARRS